MAEAKNGNSKLKFVYIAGPMSLGDTIVNVRNALFVAEQLRERGFVPFVPQLSVLWHLLTPNAWETWLAMDLQWLTRADAVLRLPGNSRGADLETQHAVTQGIPVFHSIDDLLAAIK